MPVPSAFTSMVPLQSLSTLSQSSTPPLVTVQAYSHPLDSSPS